MIPDVVLKTTSGIRSREARLPHWPGVGQPLKRGRVRLVKAGYHPASISVSSAL